MLLLLLLSPPWVLMYTPDLLFTSHTLPTPHTHTPPHSRRHLHSLHRPFFRRKYPYSMLLRKERTPRALHHQDEPHQGSQGGHYDPLVMPQAPHGPSLPGPGTCSGQAEVREHGTEKHNQGVKSQGS